MRLLLAKITHGIFYEISCKITSTRCARATLAVQAHGTPLAHNIALVGTPTFDMQVSLFVARERLLRFRRNERHSRIT